MEKRSHILHKLVEVEVDANRSLKHFESELLEQQVMADPLRDGWIAVSHVGCCGKCFNRFNDEVAREIAADQAYHLMIIQRSNGLIVGCCVEHFLDLLEEGLTVELCR